MRSLLAGVAAVTLLALAAVGCGGGGYAATAGNPATAGEDTATVGVATIGLGKVLVDSQGRTLYLFEKDSGGQSTCFGPCASAWPPLPAPSEPTVGGGANASLVATAKRSDGAPQVTYAGHPLYLYAGDHQPGDANGQDSTGFGARWSALSPAGSAITGRQSSSSDDESPYIRR
jgi:predicted lipoprotein with Yx(FWY)xxD motif